MSFLSWKLIIRPTICENKAKRWEFKCFFASPSLHYIEFYLNIYEKKKKPVYEFLDKW